MKSIQLTSKADDATIVKTPPVLSRPSQV